MKKIGVVIISLVIFTIILGILGVGILAPKPQPVANRQILQIPLTLANASNANQPSIEANKLPEFVYALTDHKFDSIISQATNIGNLVKATIVHSVYADEKINATVSVDAENRKLTVKPQDVINFRPGMYKLSLTLRTLEGDVNIDQDFTWGVIAINTNKSIYNKGEKVKIGMGVLNNSGETLCLTGFKHIQKITLIITDPNGERTNFSTVDNSIRDSGKCGPTSVTNDADFQSDYQTTTAGIYQMTVEATIQNQKRQITDYFKVDPSVTFDVERTSFPTRIYPHSIYPVTFTVTAKNDYSGTVIDTVPGFFDVQGVQDGGITKQNGSFTQIVWNVNLKKGEKKYFSYFIKFPPVSPEFYLIGPIKIGDFSESRQWQIASDAINSTSGVIAYEDNGSQATYYRVWSGTYPFGAQGTISSGAGTPTNSKWFREVSSPKTGEKLVAVLDFDNGSGVNKDTYYIYRWTGSAPWVKDLSFQLTINTLNTSEAFDIAYEELSGDALFVYSDGVNAQLLYRYYTSATHTWSAAGNAGAAYDVYKRWVRLRPQFNTDTILVGYQNNSQRIGAMIWDGSVDTFGNQFSDASGSVTALSGTRPVRSFEAVYETASANPLIFWGTTSNNIVYRRYTSGGGWAAEAVAATGFTNDIAWLTAAADPVSTSNYIAIGTQENTTPTCKMGIWNGSNLRMDGNSYPCRSATVQRLIDVGFEYTGSKAMWTINTATAAAQMAWLTWSPSTPNGGFTALTTETGSSGNLESIQLTSDLNTKSMIALYVDAAGDLWDREWDGNTDLSWSAKPGSALYDNIQDSGETAEAYGFGFDRNLESQVAYRWFANSGNLGVSSALTAQDTPYTLTTEHQQFRLRMLIYTPDTLTTSLRNYKLQYVDPGSGTCDLPSGGTPANWIDVAAAGGGGQISYYDNTGGGITDNATLTANPSLDPTYRSKYVNTQTYKEGTAGTNPTYFTNSVAAIPADQLGEWDFSLIDNTTYDRNAQTFCFRVARTSNVVLQTDIYPQISTAALSDVIIQGNAYIQGNATIR